MKIIKFQVVCVKAVGLVEFASHVFQYTCTYLVGCPARLFILLNELKVGVVMGMKGEKSANYFTTYKH